MPKRSAMPALSPSAEEALATYQLALAEGEDMRPVTSRTYLSDLRQCVAWCETTGAAGQDDAPAWTPAMLSTPRITRYRIYFQLGLNTMPFNYAFELGQAVIFLLKIERYNGASSCKKPGPTCVFERH